MPVSPWFTLPGGEDNYVTFSDLDASGWEADVVRPGTRRLGDYTIQENIGDPWGFDARDCSIAHAMFGNQNDTYIWDENCPLLIEGPADLELLGSSAVGFTYSDHTGIPFAADIAHMSLRLVAYGIWLKPVELNLPPYGVLDFPTPEEYGYPSGSTLEFESETVDLWKVEIADRTGTDGSNPDTEYAVNYALQPSFSSGAWGAWAKGVMPGLPLPDVPLWVDGPEDYSMVFASDPVDFADKTWYPLDIPADGFASVTQDYENDSYDYGVAAGPAEAFEDRPFTASRSAPTGIYVNVFVTSPRFRWVFDAIAAPPLRVVGRPGDGMTTAPRVFGGGNTVQRGLRVGPGAIL